MLKKFKVLLFSILATTLIVSCETGESPANSDSPEYEKAKEIILSAVSAGKGGQLKISGLNKQMTKGSTVKSWGRTVTMPDDGFLFLVDPSPLANWEHDCQWKIVNPETGHIETIDMRTPPDVADIGEMEVLYQNPVEKKTSYDNIRGILDTQFSRKTITSTSAAAFTYRQKHALLISGGYDSYNNHIRYWGDVAYMYRTLVNRCLFKPSEIEVCMADGDDPAADRSDGTNSPTDLDGDGTADYTKDSTRATILSELQNLVDTVEENDLVYIFTTDHGGQNSDGSVVLYTWGDSITDAEFAGYINQLPASAVKVIFMEQCYSGGFIDDLAGVENLVISTAADATHVSYAGDTYPNFDEFSYEYTAALNWLYSDIYDTNPGSVDADINEDLICSIEEAHNWAVANDNSGDNPQFGDTDSIGSIVHLDLLNLQPYEKDGGFEAVGRGYNQSGPAVFYMIFNHFEDHNVYEQSDCTTTVDLTAQLSEVTSSTGICQWVNGGSTTGTNWSDLQDAADGLYYNCSRYYTSEINTDFTKYNNSSDEQERENRLAYITENYLKKNRPVVIHMYRSWPYGGSYLVLTGYDEETGMVYYADSGSGGELGSVSYNDFITAKWYRSPGNSAYYYRARWDGEWFGFYHE
ncbi:MAG: hypothetical protein GY754_12250 [bacterium]|nr:hypothetical protein [bacterium]